MNWSRIVIDETGVLSDFDHYLLGTWRLSEEHPRAREMVLVGRLQRAMNSSVVDGRCGPRTLAEVRLVRPIVGPELERILCFHALR